MTASAALKIEPAVAQSGARLLINADTRERMKAILADIQSGRFAEDWIAENEAGKPAYDALVKADNEQPIEIVGQALRRRMAWLNAAEPASAQEASAKAA